MLCRMFRHRVSSLIRRGRLWLALAPMLLATAAARAQEASAAPQPSLQKSPPVWLGLLVMFIMLAMVITVSLMPSRRGHQD